MSHREIVGRFCESWTALDVERILGFLADDCVFHDVVTEPLVGRAAIGDAFRAFLATIDRAELVIRSIAESAGGVVLTDRLDRFRRDGSWIEVPVMGRFDLRNGKITTWRDHSDPKRAATLLGADAEASRRVALECLSKMDSPAFLDLLAEDATYTVVGPSDFLLAGTRTKAELASPAGEFYRLMAVAPRLTPTGVTAEGNRVAVEAESHGQLANGRSYDNHYHFVFVVAGGKVKRVTEYVDTLYAQRVLFG